VFVGGGGSSGSGRGGGDDKVVVGEYDDDEWLQSIRTKTWEGMRDANRESFLSERVPGEEYREEEEAAVVQPDSDPADGSSSSAATVPPPPDRFLLLLLVPEYCDYLHLTNMYRQVDTLIDEESGEWSSKRVNP